MQNLLLTRGHFIRVTGYFHKHMIAVRVKEIRSCSEITYEQILRICYRMTCTSDLSKRSSAALESLAVHGIRTPSPAKAGATSCRIPATAAFSSLHMNVCPASYVQVISEQLLIASILLRRVPSEVYTSIPLTKSFRHLFIWFCGFSIICYTRFIMIPAQ